MRFKIDTSKTITEFRKIFCTRCKINLKRETLENAGKWENSKHLESYFEYMNKEN